MDEFKDEAKIIQMEEREIVTWLEVSLICITRSKENIHVAFSFFFGFFFIYI